MDTSIEPIERKYDELHEQFLEAFQGRSDFQISNFVVGAHKSPERQFAQCIAELQAKYFSIKRADINRRRLKHEIATGKCPFDIEEKEVALQELDIALTGALREFDALYQIYQQLPKFKNQELQEAERTYWLDRIAEQAQRDIEATGAVGTGNAEALRQVGLIDGYSERFLQSVQEHPGLVEKAKDDLLQIQTQ